MQIPLLALVLCVLVPVSGFIAWAGDRIGHQIGKRRHTLLGLRPRHTAMLFTVGSGIGISLVSFLMLYFSSEGFRVVLSQGARLLTVNKSLKKQNLRLQTEVSDRVSETQAAQAAAKQALAGRDAAQRLRNEAFGQEQRAQKDLGAAKRELLAAQGGLRQAKALVQSAETAYRETRGKLGVSASQLSTVRRGLTEARTHLKTARGRITSAETGASRASRAALVAVADKKRIEASANRTLDGFTKRIREQSQNAEVQRVAFQAEVAAKQAELKRLQSEVDAIEARRVAADAQRVTAEAQLSASLSRTTALRRGQITFRVGEEVARVSVASDQSVWRIESALERFWKSAARKAQERGATSEKKNGTQALALAPRIPPSDTPTGAESGTVANASLPGEEEVFRQLAQTIRRSKDPVAVVLTTSANAVVGEPVLVDMVTYRNPVVLGGGVRLGETSIAGSAQSTREEIADLVYDFLRRDVRKTLLAAGVIPTASGDSEDGASVVSLSGSEWLKIMDDLKRSNYRARLLVKTAKPLRAADPVALDFEVKALPTFSTGGAMPPGNNP